MSIRHQCRNCMFAELCSDLMKTVDITCDRKIGSCFSCVNSVKVLCKDGTNDVVCKIGNQDCMFCSNYKDKLVEE